MYHILETVHDIHCTVLNNMYCLLHTTYYILHGMLRTYNMYVMLSTRRLGVHVECEETSGSPGVHRADSARSLEPFFVKFMLHASLQTLGFKILWDTFPWKLWMCRGLLCYSNLV